MEERFSERDVDQLATYLLEHNIPEETCELFKGTFKYMGMALLSLYAAGLAF